MSPSALQTLPWAPRIEIYSPHALAATRSPSYNARLAGAGWSSLAARRAHNPKVAGSNPAPATINLYCSKIGCYPPRASRPR